jgi:hypothetical protein
MKISRCRAGWPTALLVSLGLWGGYVAPQLATLDGSGVAFAAKRKKKAAKRVKRLTKASEATTKGIATLLGKLQFGMSLDDVKKIALQMPIAAEYAKKIETAKGDAFLQDKIRGEEAATQTAAAKRYHVFEGQKTGWEVSVLDQEFAHNSGESMLEGLDEAKQRRYYFFKDGRLWKVFIAFKQEAFKGLDFEQFASRIQERYGPANPIRKVDKYSKKEFLAYLEWPPSSNSQLRALDRSTTYDIFCLVVSNKDVEDRLKDSRKEGVAGKPVKDGLVEGITRSGDEKDGNEAVVDQITGTGTDGALPEVPQTSSENSGGPQKPEKKKKKKKGSSSDE